MVYKGLVCNEAGRVPHSDYVYFKAVSKRLTLMKFNRNIKRPRGRTLRRYMTSNA